MSLGPIDDPAIKIKPTSKLIQFVTCSLSVEDCPANFKALKNCSINECSEIRLSYKDVKWLDGYLKEHRKTSDAKVYLHEFLEGADVTLPQPKVIPRDPVLEARVQKLTAQQNAREYEAMTKGVDSVRKRLPEDTIAFQMKEINRQLIAVAQFIFSVLAGFTFGFIGVELIVGNLDFGFRLLLGIICALVIALAEIYFLAKKLNEVHLEEFGPRTKLHQE